MFEVRDVCVKDVFEMDGVKISEDRVTCVTGQSGSGKSTFLRLLNRLDDPHEGTILYKGKDIRKLDPVELRRKVLMVPQTPLIFPGTIKHNLLIGLEFTKQSPTSDQDLKKILHTIELPKELDTNAMDLSGGEKQRLSLARAMLMDKVEVILLDEPSSSLDDETAKHVLKAFLNQAKQENRATIMVSHDKQLCDELAEDNIDLNQYRLYKPSEEEGGEG